MIRLGAVADTGEQFELPDDLITQVGAVIARRGWGKTYCATLLAEQLLEIGAQLVAIDPVGVWWGISAHAETGKPIGAGVVVFGGEHANVPISETQGAAVAELVIESGSSAVIDVSLFTKNAMKRFVADFVERLYHLAKTHRRPRMLVLEEAQVFAPQSGMPGDERMLGAVQTWVRLGRNYSCGCLLVTQRPQSVSKEVLNQAELLILGQLVGAHERKAIKDWVVENVEVKVADDGKADAGARYWLSELPSLSQGKAWVWSPSWLGRFEKVLIRKKRSIDTSATLKIGDQAKVTFKGYEPRALEDLVKRLEQLSAPPAAAKAKGKGKLELVHSKAQADELGSLRAELEQTREHFTTTAAKVDARERDLDYIAKSLGDAISATVQWLDVLRELVQVAQGSGHAEGKRVTRPKLHDVHEKGTRTPRMPPLTHSLGIVPKPVGIAAAAGMPDKALTMLEQLRAIYPLGLTRTQLATAASMVSRGGTFSGYLRALNERHLLSKSASGLLQVSDAGWKLLGVNPIAMPAARSRDRLLEYWRNVLKPRDREAFDLVVAQPGITRSGLAKALGMAERGGTFSSRLRDLNKSGLVTHVGGRYRLAPLFDQPPVIRV